MKYYQIAVIKSGQRSSDSFTYHCEDDLLIGSFVRVTFGRQNLNGVIIRKTVKPKFTTKSLTPIPQPVMPERLLKLAEWMADYYCVGLSSVLQTMLPAGLHKKRQSKEYSWPTINRLKAEHKLNPEQNDALKIINSADSSKPILLHGVTGSGKTRIYLEIAKQNLKSNKNILILVPEISLTPQMLGEFQNIHNQVIVIHSGLTESQRHNLWHKIANSAEQTIVIGPRSALFCPLPNIGLIVVDECHESSYKQDQQPKYDALLVSSQLAKLHHAKIIFGSATPSITTFTFAQLQNWKVITLSKTAVKQSKNIISVDQTNKSYFTKNHYLSNQLIESISEALANNQQSLVFYNRRGSARSLQCTNCGWILECPNCHIPLILHHDHHQMRCHLCSLIKAVPTTCQSCQQSSLKFSGYGTKRLESELIKLFPHAKIKRFDTDTPKNESLLHTYQEVLDGEIDILIGTQMLTKGLDLPNLSVLGVLQADGGLQMPDVFAAERCFQTLYQAIGRIGRSGIKAKAIIQAYSPDNIIIQAAIYQNYQKFYDYELKERQDLFYPPRCFAMIVTAGYKSAESAEVNLKKWANQILVTNKNINITGPAPAFHEHIGGKHRAQLIIKSTSRKNLQNIVKQIPNNWQFELDPITLL